MFSKKDIQEALNIKIVTPQDRLDEQDKWRNAEQGKSDWNNENTPSLMVASSTCKEVARAATTMFESSHTGSPLIDYVNEQYKKPVAEIEDVAYNVLSNGKIVLKLVARNNEINVKIVTSDSYYPFQYDGLGNLTGVVFAETILKVDLYYTLLEKCTFQNDTYLIEHSAYVSKKPDTLGAPTVLTAVDEWAQLPPFVLWQQVKRPWFIEVSTKDTRPIFADGLDLIKQADKQFARILWENEGGELAVHGSPEMFTNASAANGGLTLKALQSRLYRKLRTSGNSDTKAPLDVFSPQLRVEPLNHALNIILRQYETIVGVAKGAFSDPQFQANTATEVTAAKPRFSDTVKSLQGILKDAYVNLFMVMADIAPRYGFAPMGTVNPDDIYFFFDQTTITTKKETDEANAKELATMINLVSLGLKPEYVIAFWNNVSDGFSKITEEDLKVASEKMGAVLEPPV